MSKKFTNYSKQFNKQAQEPVVETPVDVQPETVEPEVKPEQVDISQVPVKVGVVECNRLNVRKGPSKETDPVNVITKGTIVQIDEVVNEDWFKITTANGKIEGYCMSQHIELQ